MNSVFLDTQNKIDMKNFVFALVASVFAAQMTANAQITPTTETEVQPKEAVQTDGARKAQPAGVEKAPVSKPQIETPVKAEKADAPRTASEDAVDVAPAAPRKSKSETTAPAPSKTPRVATDTEPAPKNGKVKKAKKGKKAKHPNHKNGHRNKKDKDAAKGQQKGPRKAKKDAVNVRKGDRTSTEKGNDGGQF